jgi:hypothetical protein
MKLEITAIAATAIMALLPNTLACLQISGAMSTSNLGYPPVVQFMATIDNGLKTCDASWGWHVGTLGVALTCLPGYYYGVSPDSTLGYYKNPQHDFEIGQTPAGEGQTLSWSESVFGC